MSNLQQHHLHTKLQPPAVPNQHRTSSYPTRRGGTCSKHSRVWPSRGTGQTPSSAKKNQLRAATPALCGTRISHPPGASRRDLHGPSAGGRQREGGEPRPQPRPGEGRAQAPRQGRSGQGRPQREPRAPLLGLTATPPPPAGDTAEPPVQPGPGPARRATAASALPPPGGAAPHGQAPGRPRSSGGGEKEQGRGG